MPAYLVLQIRPSRELHAEEPQQGCHCGESENFDPRHHVLSVAKLSVIAAILWNVLAKLHLLQTDDQMLKVFRVATFSKRLDHLGQVIELLPTLVFLHLLAAPTSFSQELFR